MRTLVTGGAGFIGSHVSQELVHRGHKVTVLDNFVSGTIANRRRIPDKDDQVRLVRGDCKNPAHLRKALRDVGTVYHFAGNAEVRFDRIHPSVSFDENIYATHVLLEQLEGSEVETIVFASSSTVYGEPGIIPTAETYGPLEPISAYGASKL